MLEVQPADGAGGVAESIRALVAEPYRVWGAAGPDTVEDDDHRSTSHGSSSSDEYTGYHAVNQVRQAGGEALEIARSPPFRAPLECISQFYVTSALEPEQRRFRSRNLRSRVRPVHERFGEDTLSPNRARGCPRRRRGPLLPGPGPRRSSGRPEATARCGSGTP